MKLKRIVCFLFIISLVVAMVPVFSPYAWTSENVWTESFEDGIEEWIMVDAERMFCNTIVLLMVIIHPFKPAFCHESAAF